MRATIQRVSKASVSIDGNVVGQINTGLLILLGVEDADEKTDLDWLTKKISGLRIFPDENGKMNKSVVDVGGDILVVSQFTLFASTKKGTRPSFIKAGDPDFANEMCERFKNQLAEHLGKPVASGVFGADMQVSLVNDGPVTINIDTKLKE